MLITHIVVDSNRLDPLLGGQERSTRLSSALNAEYVELRNEQKQKIDISNWTLGKEGVSLTPFIFPEETEVQPKSIIRIHSGQGDNTTSDFFWNLSESVWNKVGDTAFLQDASGNLIDQRAYPTLPSSFRAQSSPHGLRSESEQSSQAYRPAIELSWDVPILFPLSEEEENPKFPNPDAIPLLIRRQERYFPGKNRRGVIPVKADREEDGSLIYETENFLYDFAEKQQEWEGDRLIETIRQYRYREDPQDLKDRILIRIIRQESQISLVRGNQLTPTRMSVRFIDRQDLCPGTVYYYTAFVGKCFGEPENQSTRRIFSRLTQASALATGSYGHALFSNLPQIHQRFDTNLPPADSVSRGDRHKGQLQRFLEVFEAHADLLHDQIDSLRNLHAPRRVDSRFLPHLAHLIGWQPRDYLNEDQQRNEISFAPEIYKTVGTIPTIKARINRIIGWKAEIREFVHNVLLSFDASRVESRWDGVVYLNGTDPPPSYPTGSIDTSDTDTEAIAKMKAKALDDPIAYSYDFGRPDGQGGYLKDDNVLYNRETIGIYMSPDVETEVFTLEEATERIRKLLREFLPIQVRVVFFLDLSVVEETYNTIEQVTEEGEDVGVQILEEEGYREVLETSSARILGWQVLVANHPEHRTTDLSFRTWHSALDQEIVELPT